MEKLKLEEVRLVGLSLGAKTTNENGQSSTDCGNLWQKFEKEGLVNKIENKLSDEIFAIYHSYESDHTKPFSYFIGCKVAPGPQVLENLDSFTLPGGTFVKKIAKGEMPMCITDAWKEIWSSDLPRAYKADFEVYGERSKNWSDAEVAIYVSVE